jgi:hypothetical protein
MGLVTAIHDHALGCTQYFHYVVHCRSEGTDRPEL